MSGQREGEAGDRPASGIPASGLPARGHSRPPFARNHLTNVTSGHRAPRVYGDLARRLAAGLVEDRPDLAAYPEAVAAWATAEAQAALLRRHLADLGPLDEEGEPRATSLTWLTRLESAATKHRATLGLDPRSEATLARDRAEASMLSVDLSALAERGAAALAARQAEPPDLAGQVLAEHRAAHTEERTRAAEQWAAAQTDDTEGTAS